MVEDKAVSIKEDYNKNCTWKKVPDVGMIEVTNACNFSCVMCSNKHMKRKKGFMSFETFTKTLDRYNEAGIKFVKLYTTGESLLHPDFMKFWRVAVSYPFQTIMISTNASLLTKDMMEELVTSPKFRIQISFSGWNERSYELRYVRGNFNDIVEKIKYLSSLIEKTGLPKNILTINGVTSATTGSIAKTKEFLIKELGFDAKQLYIHNANNWTDVVNDYNTGVIDNVDKKLNKVGLDPVLLEGSNGKKYYCHIANTRIGTLYDGKVTACGCLDVNGELVVGNIFDEGITEIRNSPEFTGFVNKLNTGNVSGLMCSRCDSLKELK